MTDWLKAKLGRARVSTLVLIVAFIVLFWVHQTFQPQTVATERPTPQVVPPGFVPDPAYTWVPRTQVQRPKEPVTTTTTPTTSPTETTTTTSPGETTTTSPTSPTAPPTTTVVDPDGPGLLPAVTMADPDGAGPLPPLPVAAPPRGVTTPTTTPPPPS